MPERPTRNLWVLVLHQIVFRTGWIFKTENVIIPAFLDLVAGAGWLRGMLPVLARAGQSIPPVFGAHALQQARLKKRALLLMAALLAVPFAVLGELWHEGGRFHPRITVALFLVSYLVFTVSYGFYQLAFGTVQGKLIRPERRGLLMVLSTFGGMIPSTLLAWWLLPGWLERADGFTPLFTFVAVCFAVSALCTLFISERPGGTPPPSRPWRGTLPEIRRCLRDDRNLRRLVIVAALLAGAPLLAPHYQALAVKNLHLKLNDLLLPVITLNVSVSFLSLLVGPLADARGYRLTLQLMIFAALGAPLYAVALSWMPVDAAGRLFWLIYLPQGVAPLLLAVLMNYTLETCSPDQHPLYLSTVNLFLTLPVFFSPAVGWLTDQVGFVPVLLFGAAMICGGGCLSLGLTEPRRGVVDGRIMTPES